MLSIDFQQPAELGLNYQTVALSSDSIDQGDSLNLNFDLYNVGEASADSFNVSVYLEKNNSIKRKLLDTTIIHLASLEKVPIFLKYNSNFDDGAGEFVFAIHVDDQKRITEIFKDNNIYNQPFYIIKDSVTVLNSAAATIQFDGTNIIDGDYVSSNPLIQINLNYQNQFPYDDTTQVSFTLDGNHFYYSQLDTIVYDTINKKVMLQFRPHFSDGEHTFNIMGDNLSNNPNDLSKLFYVSNELKLLNVYNFPNPFSTDTYFTFNLTQVPEELKIKIFTISGRLIKDIEVPPATLKINFNRIYWNGLDADGDKIANGVYLYKIITRLNNKAQSQIQKLAVIR